MRVLLVLRNVPLPVSMEDRDLASFFFALPSLPTMYVCDVLIQRLLSGIIQGAVFTLLWCHDE